MSNPADSSASLSARTSPPPPESSPEPSKPLGYWLQHLHGLLEAQFAATLAACDLTRRQWQVLNTLASASHTQAELRAALAPFWTGDGAGPDAGPGSALDGPSGLRTRGWVRAASGTDAVDAPTEADRRRALVLTDAGRAGHAEAASRVAAARVTVLGDDLTPDDYRRTVHVLATMCAHVEADLATGPGST